MSMFDIEDSSTEKAPLRARLLAEAEVVTIAPPPTLAVRAAGTQRIHRRRALQAVSGAAAACAIAGAVVAWSPRHATATPVEPGLGATPQTASSAHKVGTPPPSGRPSQAWPTNFAPDLPGYVHAKDLGAGWLGPYAIPEQDVSPTLTRLLNCKGSEGQFIATHLVQEPVFRFFNAPDRPIALVEGVYSFSKGQAAYVMGVLGGAPNTECKDIDTVVPGTTPVGDQSIVLGLTTNPHPTSWIILIRSGDKIAFVSTGALASKPDADAWRDGIESTVAARLTGG